jgi:poly-gamma-glutamate synthesis protein (capsule biosynthesis protein)
MIFVLIVLSEFSFAESRRFSILFIGDILLVNELEKKIVKNGLDYPFKKIKKYIHRFDFVAGNLEAPITDRGLAATGKPYAFRVLPEHAVCLNDLKLDVCTLANNHIMDYETEGLIDTMKYLDRLGISRTGAGLTIADSRKPALLRFGATEICILAYNERPPSEFSATDHQAGSNPMNMEYISEDIETYKSASNIVIVSLHWGIEQTIIPQPYQQKLAHKIIDFGADAIVGHHPHWPQGIELYKNRPIIYSLGNFINGYSNLIEKDNIMAALHYKNTSLHAIQIVPIAGKNKISKFQPCVLEGPRAMNTLKEIAALSGFFKTEMRIHNNNGYIMPEGTNSIPYN